MISEFTITTTTLRPRILYQTLRSFFVNLKSVRWEKAYINIDPMGSPCGPQIAEVVSICRDFFNEAHCRVPSVASFPAAVRWCFQQPRSLFFMHLEDDWLLQEPVDVSKDICLPLIAQYAGPGEWLDWVGLRAYNWPPTDRRICLSPGVWRRDVAMQIGSRLVDSANPEQQMRPRCDSNPEGGKAEPFLGKLYPDHVVLKDIGRAHLATSGWRKDNGAKFTTWVPV